MRKLLLALLLLSSITFNVIADKSYPIMDGELNWIPSFDYLWSGAIDADDIESVLDTDKNSHVIKLYARGGDKSFTFRPPFVTADIEGIKFDAKASNTVKKLELKVNTSDGNTYRLLFKNSYRLRIKGKNIFVPLDDYAVNQWGHHDIHILDLIKELTGNNAISIESVQRFVINTQDISLDNVTFYAAESPVTNNDNNMDGEQNWVSDFSYQWNGAINASDIASTFNSEKNSNVIQLLAHGANKYWTFTPSYISAGTKSLSFDVNVSSAVKRLEIKVNANDGNTYRMLFKSNYRLRRKNKNIFAPFDAAFELDQWGHHQIHFLDILRDLTANSSLQIDTVQRLVINTKNVLIDNLTFYAEENPADIAQAKIEAYALDNNNPVPTAQDYDLAGILGVTNANLDSVNAAVAAAGKEGVDTKNELQTVVTNSLSVPSTCISREQLQGMISNNEDVTQVNTSCITKMNHIFDGNTYFNQDISGWDVSNVVTMYAMFRNARLFNQDISGWDVSNVTNMSYMLKRTVNFNQNISQWDVSKVVRHPGFSLSSLLQNNYNPFYDDGGNRTVLIMPLGDSITAGYGGSDEPLPSYRRDLWHALTNAGYNFDFVGSKHEYTDITISADLQDYDPDFEGHSGKKASEINTSSRLNVTRLMNEGNYTPDIALIHLGTNDIYQDNNYNSSTDDEAILNSIGGIIEQIQAKNQNVTILLAQIIPMGREDVSSFNSKLRQRIASYATATSSVIIVDQYSGFNLPADTFDQLHPSATGELKMSNRWYEALIQLPIMTR